MAKLNKTEKVVSGVVGIILLYILFYIIRYLKKD